MGQQDEQEAPAGLKGNVKHWTCRGCYGRIPLAKLAVEGKKMGLRSIELVDPGPDWETLIKHGLICAMTPSHDLGQGLSDKKNHAKCFAAIRASIEATAAAGWPNVICFSGNRSKDITDEEGLANCAVALEQVVGLAERKKVTICAQEFLPKRDPLTSLGEAIRRCDV